MHFDLISDLHNNWWPAEQQIDFRGLGTSLLAVVAGDVCQSWEETHDFLRMLGKHYRHVLYVDGNHEHNGHGNMHVSCGNFQDRLQGMNNLTYLHKCSIVLDDTAFIGCNGWWTYDFCEPELSRVDCWQYLLEQGANEFILNETLLCAKEDAINVANQVQLFDKDPRINKIVIITHTSPLRRFRYISENMHVAHYGRAGNSYMINSLQFNQNKKVKAWCFGHCHHRVDETVNGIRFVCHPRGRPDDNLGQIYYPKLIEI
jgi:predicted phosphodiesterase